MYLVGTEETPTWDQFSVYQHQVPTQYLWYCAQVPHPTVYLGTRGGNLSLWATTIPIAVSQEYMLFVALTNASYGWKAPGLHMVREGEPRFMKKTIGGVERFGPVMSWMNSPPSSGQIRRLAGFEKIRILYVAMAEKPLLCGQKLFFGHKTPIFSLHKHCSHVGPL